MNQDDMDKQRVYWEAERKRRSPDHPVVEAFATSKINYVRKSININKGTKILDVGCGNGFFTYYLSKISSPVGVDYSRHMLLINPCEILVQGSAVSLPFKDGSFDVVFCSNLLHHLKDPKEAILEMMRVSGEYVVLSEPNRNNPLMALFSAKVVEERGALNFSLGYMRGLAEECGLKIIDSCSIGSIVPNKTPLSLLRLFKMVDWKNPVGFYNIVVARGTR